MLKKSYFEAYEKAVNSVSNPNNPGGLFSSKKIIWKQRISGINNTGDDPLFTYKDIPLLVQANFNYMRSWPITLTTESGEIDRQSVQLLINKEYLKQLNFLNSDGYWIYNPALDYIIMDGLVHEPVGDTPVSQSITDDLFISLIIKRAITQTGDIR